MSKIKGSQNNRMENKKINKKNKIINNKKNSKLNKTKRNFKIRRNNKFSQMKTMCLIMKMKKMLISQTPEPMLTC